MTPPEGGEQGRELSSSPPIPATPLPWMLEPWDLPVPASQRQRYGIITKKDRSKVVVLEVGREDGYYIVHAANSLPGVIAAKEKAEAELERLRGALEWYASDECWTIDNVENGFGGYGKRAKEALRPPPSDADKAGTK